MIKSNELILEAKYVVENNFQDPKFNVSTLCFFIKVSRASLYRKITQHCQCSPQEFIEDFRLEIAKKKIEEDDSIIKEIAYEVGFLILDIFLKSSKINI